MAIDIYQSKSSFYIVNILHWGRKKLCRNNAKDSYPKLDTYKSCYLIG